MTGAGTNGDAMPPRSNPLRLNKLQLRTLALMQELARHPETATMDADTGEAVINQVPRPHGDHVHIGSLTVSSRDASGLSNQSVWTALERKGMIRGHFPMMIIVTAAGLEYDTGLVEPVARPSDH